MRINNLSAMSTYRHYSINNARLARSIERLSSGYRINRAADDPAGLAISEKMRLQIRGMRMAVRNVQDAASMVQTAEGVAQTCQDIMKRLQELAVQAGNETNGLDTDLKCIAIEMAQLIEELASLMGQAKFNGNDLFAGGFSMTIQAGANSGEEITLSWDMGMGAPAFQALADLLTELQNFINDPADYGGSHTIDHQAFRDMLGPDGILSKAMDALNSYRATLGAYHNRLMYRLDNLENNIENLSAAESRIRDVDMAKEMMEYTKYNILAQVSTAMLAQANSQAELVLQLLG